MQPLLLQSAGFILMSRILLSPVSNGIYILIHYISLFCNLSQYIIRPDYFRPAACYILLWFCYARYFWYGIECVMLPMKRSMQICHAARHTTQRMVTAVDRTAQANPPVSPFNPAVRVLRTFHHSLVMIRRRQRRYDFRVPLVPLI